jgi:lipopolysaccharide transport system ATP-binding protein
MDRIRSIIQSGTTVLFVSHNLKAVTEICQRAMLLEHGKVLTIDKTNTVAREYLSHGSDVDPTPQERKPAYISKVRIRDRAGEQATF